MSSHTTRVHDLQVVSHRGSPAPSALSLAATSIPALLTEVVQLVRVTKTHAANLEAIRIDHKLRTQQATDSHTEIMAMIEREYPDRAQQMTQINENVKLLIAAGHSELAAPIMLRLTEIFAASPMEKALEYRRRNST